MRGAEHVSESLPVEFPEIVDVGSLHRDRPHRHRRRNPHDDRRRARRPVLRCLPVRCLQGSGAHLPAHVVGMLHPPDDPRNGTTVGYELGCRCDTDRAIKRAYECTKHVRRR